MSISLAYMTALRDYLIAQYVADPPAIATIGTIQVGSFQADREANPAIVTLHIHNPYDENFREPHWELITDQANQGGGRRHALWGGYMEMGGALYWYYWWVRLENYQTVARLSQADTQSHNDDLVRWLVRKIEAAQPGILTLASLAGETLVRTLVLSTITRERGGTPDAYIWSSLLKVQGLVHRELT